MESPNQIVGEKQHGAKTLFWYFSLFWTLGVVAFATGGIWFQVINKFFPREVSYAISNAFSQGAVKGAIAALIVGTPAFFVFAWLIRKAIGRGEINLKKGPRQWVGYLVLFIVVATALGDIIASLMAFLNGDFTMRFLLKSLVILAITSWIFVYFWFSLRSDDALQKSPFPKIVMAVSGLVILVTLAAGFMLVDSPVAARAKAYDNQRLNDLRQIQYSVEGYYSRFTALPQSLSELDDIQIIPTDPETSQPYPYEIINETEYKLCATFTTSNRIDPEFYDRGYDLLHDIGENCFSFLVGKTPLYPTEPIPIPIQ